MKRVIILLTLIILFLNMFSCKNAEESETATTREVTSNESVTTDTLSERNVETEKPKEEVTEKEPDKSVSDDNTKQADIQENNDPDLKSDDKKEEQPKPALIKDVSFIRATFNEVIYNHMSTDEFFGEASIYHSIDLNRLALSVNTAEIQYYYPTESDGFYIGKTETAKVYNLPADLQNDEDLYFLAVEMPNGETELFYKINDRKEGDTLNKLFSVWERLYGQCVYTSYDSVESISLSGSSNIFDKKEYVIKSKDEIKSLFERICNYKYVVDRSFRTEGKDMSEDKQGIYCIYIKFNDGSEFVLNYERIGMTLDNYIADEDFEEFLKSFMTEKNLVKE